MLTFGPVLDDRSCCTILCIGAHCDDIEIGCGASLLRFIAEQSATGNSVACHWVVATSNPLREAECRASAEHFLAGAEEKSVTIWSFRDGYLPYVGGEVKDAFERLKCEVHPNIVFTHYRHDLHQDHRLINQLTWNTFRNHFILEYEILKYDGDIGCPNFYISVHEGQVNRKVEFLLRHYPSQHSHSWFTPEALTAITRLRGVEANSSTGYAEGFYARKVCW